VVGVRDVAVTGLLLTVAVCGCFYVDPIEPRPHVQIEVEPNKLTRGGAVTLMATFTDTNTDAGKYTWTLYTCAAFDQSARDCDAVPFLGPTGETKNMVSFSVPVMTKAGTDKTQSIAARLEARSDRGAVAEQIGNGDFPVADAPPSLSLDRSAHSYTVGAPIDLVATFGDPDDALGAIKLDWSSTPDAAFVPVPVPGPGPAGKATAGKRLVPDQPGKWDIQVIASDPIGTPNEQHLTFTVDADHPPCLGQWQPIAPPPGSTLPVTDVTVFQVPLVNDDLDAYPPVTDAPEFGATRFAWSILPPCATERQLLTGATGNRVQFDPAAFHPGDIVELRVEIFDRSHTTALPCADSAATCSIDAAPSCLQRQTWRVEVR
jgi:hypothetical protein